MDGFDEEIPLEALEFLHTDDVPNIGECIRWHIGRLDELAKVVGSLPLESTVATIVIVQRLVDIAHNALHVAVEVAEQEIARGGN